MNTDKVTTLAAVVEAVCGGLLAAHLQSEFLSDPSVEAITIACVTARVLGGYFTNKGDKSNEGNTNAANPNE